METHDAQRPVILIRDLHKSYYIGEIEVPALRGVDLEVYPGEVIAIMGPSGSGKSTLMNMLGCLDSPTTGEYRLEGQLVSELVDDELALVRNEKIGFVFQKYNLLPRATAIENVELPLRYSQDQSHMRERSREALERVGLADRMLHKPNELSGGQQQRVAIARAVVANPKLILADEPTGNLDSKNGKEVMGLLSELNNEGTTIVMVTHSQHDAGYADRIINLFDGQVVTEVSM